MQKGGEEMQINPCEQNVKELSMMRGGGTVLNNATRQDNEGTGTYKTPKD